MIPSPMSRRRFTGRHMALIMVAFFAVVVAVNMLMATLAVKGFGGTVVDNSYVASQQFNGWLRAARAQAKLGWKSEMTLDSAQRIRLRLTARDASALNGADVRGVALHPLGRLPDVSLHFDAVAPGHYVTRAPLPLGRWQVAITVRRGTDVIHIVQEIR